MAFGLPPQPAPTEKTALLLSPHTKSLMIGAKAVKSVADRRFFGAWKELKTRQHLHAIVKDRLKATSALLQLDGNGILASELEAASPHWLRHTFAKAALLRGQTMREVAGLLGHASVDTTMVYTDQDALDLVRAFERENVEMAREG
jgi:site-specific recombinase XerD